MVEKFEASSLYAHLHMSIFCGLVASRLLMFIALVECCRGHLQWIWMPSIISNWTLLIEEGKIPLWKPILDSKVFLQFKNVEYDFFFLLVHLVTFLEAL